MMCLCHHGTPLLLPAGHTAGRPRGNHPPQWPAPRTLSAQDEGPRFPKTLIIDFPKGLLHAFFSWGRRERAGWELASESRIAIIVSDTNGVLVGVRRVILVVLASAGFSPSWPRDLSDLEEWSNELFGVSGKCASSPGPKVPRSHAPRALACAGRPGHATRRASGSGATLPRCRRRWSTSTTGGTPLTPTSGRWALVLARAHMRHHHHESKPSPH